MIKMSLTLNGEGNLVTMDMGKDQGTSSQSSLIKLAFRDPRLLRSLETSRLRKRFFPAKSNKLGNLDTQKSMDSPGMHPRALRALCNDIIRLTIEIRRNS